jgi:pimeloyl-ACP methyl ester carboxylesterase
MKTWNPMAAIVAGAVALGAATGWTAQAQDACVRIRAQDPAVDNLVDPPGYVTAEAGTLGGVIRAGAGAQAVVLIPGLGFSGDVFGGLMASLAEDYRVIAVTLPGFGGTAAPPSPGEDVSFGAQSWTNGALAALEKVIADENLERPIVVGHWLTGTQLALRLALAHPDDVRAVVLLAGVAKMMVTDPAYAEYYATPERRVASVDAFLAPKWFRTVTRETWDDNNFLPGDYAAQPVMGLRLWRQAAAAPLHVWVRYLCEFNAQDITPSLNGLDVPTLRVEPGLDGLWYECGSDYMDAYCRRSWEGVPAVSPWTVVTIPGARACPWVDRPDDVRDAIAKFLAAAP